MQFITVTAVFKQMTQIYKESIQSIHHRELQMTFMGG